MRNQWLGGGALAAGFLVFAGLVFGAVPGSAPSVQAQSAECPDVDDEEVQRCLVIAKLTDPDDDDTTDFDFEFDSSDFSLENGEAIALELEDGETHEVTEAETDGWTLANIDCEDDEGVDVDEDVGDMTVTITVTAEEDEDAYVTCTFVNEMDATPTATSTATATTTSTATATSTSNAGTSNTPVVPTPIAPTPRPVTSEVQSGTISPPSTGSGGLK